MGKRGEETFGLTAFGYGFAQKVPQDGYKIYMNEREPEQCADGSGGMVRAALFLPAGEPYAALNMEAAINTLRTADKAADPIANAKVEPAL